MDARLGSFITLYVFPSGRRTFALKQTLKVAETDGLSSLATHLRNALAHESSVRNLEVSWRAQERSKTPNADELRAADVELDAALSSFDAQFTASRATADASARLKLDALKLKVFPDGLNGIVAAAWDVARVEVQRILDLLETPEARELADSLRLETYRTVLRSRLAKFNALRPQTSPQRIENRDVEAAQARGQSLLLATVAMILGLHPTDEARDVQARTRLLWPIIEQQEQLAAAYKGRGGPSDVDPDSGLLVTPGAVL